MRHRKSFNHLGRTTAHRSAMLANMASSLILHKRIKTTTAKAKALRCYVEPLITKSKDDTTHSRRTVFGYLQNKDAVTELFREVSVKVAERPGGYLRILKIGSRYGDNADMCIVELVDFNEILTTETKETKTKTGRRRRSGGKKKAEDVPQAAESVAIVKSTQEAEVVKEDEENLPEENTAEVDSGSAGKPEEETPDSQTDIDTKPDTNTVSEENEQTTETGDVEDDRKITPGTEDKTEDDSKATGEDVTGSENEAPDEPVDNEK